MSWGCLLWGVALGCLALASPASAQRPVALDRPVQLTPGRRPLGAVLAELARQSQLPLSYSSSLLPLAHRYQVRPGPPRPLGVVLREVLHHEHLAYGLLEGQLVLWPDRVAPPAGITLLDEETSPPRPKPGLPAGRATAPAASTGQKARPTGAGPIVHQANTPASTARNRGATSLNVTQQVTPVSALPRRRAVVPRVGQRAQAALAAAYSAAHSGETLPAVSGRPRPARGLGSVRGGAARPPLEAASRELASLPLRAATLELAALPASQPVTVVPVRQSVSASINPATSRPTPRLRGLYAHAEAGVSESLPVGAIFKLGVPRAYLLLGAALAPAGRQNGAAFGLGLGTAGRARGRFTPNLDALAWRVGADHDQAAPPTLLLQLRPQVAWQVRRGSRLALVAGPTLNLASAHQRGAQVTHWDFARDQWLWVNQVDDESLLRLWPGVQVGVRF